MIKAILFDMNGIIIDDEHIHEMAFRETVKPFGVDLTHEAYLKCCAGKTDKAGYESIAEMFSTTLPVEQLLKEKGQFYLKLFPENKKDYPGVINLIHQLSTEYTLALTSSSSRVEVELITKEFGLDKVFKLRVTGNDVKKGKPDPEPYLITCERLGLLPNECVVIEDSRSGVQSAKAAGCFCIGVTTTHSEEALSQADVVVQSFGQINNQLLHQFN